MSDSPSHPVSPSTVYVMVAVPGPTPVTFPVASTVATSVWELAHVPEGSPPVTERLVVCPARIVEAGPVISPASGIVLTVTSASA